MKKKKGDYNNPGTPQSLPKASQKGYRYWQNVGDRKRKLKRGPGKYHCAKMQMKKSPMWNFRRGFQGYLLLHCQKTV